MKSNKEVEQSIIKKYRKEIWSKFTKAINDYELLKLGDKVAICISGGKDSFLMAKCFQELKRHGKFEFDLVFIVMNPGYSDCNLQKIINNAKELEIPIEIFNTDVFDVSKLLNGENPCYMCARMRRGHLYNKAMELGCNKIALGHHFNDVIETILLNVLYGSCYKTMMPKLKSTNFKGMELIRPMYLVKERYIKNWVAYNELEFLNCSCDFAESNSDSKRKEIKDLIETLRKNSEYIENSIFKSAENINLETIISYKDDNKIKHFLDNYDDKSEE